MSGAAEGRELIAWLRWLGGPIAWSAQFLIVYASESLLCRAGLSSAHLVVGVVVSLAAALAALIAMQANRGNGGTEGYVFMNRIGIALGWTGLLGITWTALPLAMLPACAAYLPV